MIESNRYRQVHYSNIIADSINVHMVKELLRQDMSDDIWETIKSELSVKPSYKKKWITKELDLNDDEITVTITTKKGKKIEFTKKLEIYSPTMEDLEKWDKTHSEEFISRIRSPPANEVGGNTGVLR